MNTLNPTLDRLHRPSILVEAARQGLALYERRRDLRRMLRAAIPATPGAALEVLLPIEEQLERRRVEGESNYSVTRHVDVLTAVLAEALSLKAA